MALIILAVLFLANAVVASAWASTCLMTDTTQMGHEMTSDMSGDMPCHEMPESQDQPEQHDHCDGICLCLHASLSQHIIADASGQIVGPNMSARGLIMDNERTTASVLHPPYRPPIASS
ncbi:MAG: hypothetical protein Alpg2KO_11480 [Alphaproteobacteria bacterium]